MVQGEFKGFTHDHYFSEAGTGTVMRDVFDYESPYGIFGSIADVLFLEKYMIGLLEQRNRLIKEAAESEDWRNFLG